MDTHYGRHELLKSLKSAENGEITPGIAVFQRMIGIRHLGVKVLQAFAPLTPSHA